MAGSGKVTNLQGDAPAGVGWQVTNMQWRGGHGFAKVRGIKLLWGNGLWGGVRNTADRRAAPTTEAICSWRSMAHSAGRHGSNHGSDSFGVDRVQDLGKRGHIILERFVP